MSEPNYAIRIISPPDVAHSYETRTVPTLDGAEDLAWQIATKLSSTGVREFEIHVVDQNTSVVEKTIVRKVQQLPAVAYDNN